MRLAILTPLALTALLLLPQARANGGDDDAEASPPQAEASAGLWEAHAQTFDLDGDGRITWEEYQKVTSGFTLLDADKDGVITKADVESLGNKLGKGAHESHAAVFLGTPGGGFHQLFGTPPAGDMDGLMRLLPLLLGAQGGHGMHPWMGGMRGGCGHPGCRTGSGMRIMPWLHSGPHGSERSADGAHGLIESFQHMVPESLKHLVAFSVVAGKADTDDDRAITRDEWSAGLKAVTKEDGSLDLSGLEESVGIHGLPFPGGNAKIFEMLLDLNGDGKVTAQDFEGVFEKADKNDDGKVDHDELAPSGMGMFHGR